MSTADPPPSYHVRLDSHPNDTTKGSIGSDVKVQEQLVNYLKTTARATIITDLLKLSTIITSIENDFATVGSAMARLDDRNIVSNKFSPQWQALHEEYTTLMHVSQRTANEISDKIDTLVKVHVPLLRMAGVPLAVKKDILGQYIKELELFQPKAEENSTRFLRLGQSVMSFKNSLKYSVESEKVEVDKKLEEIDKQIAKLESNLAVLGRQIKKGWTAVTTFMSGGSKAKPVEIAGVTSLTDIAPTVGKEMMEIALAYLNKDLADDLKKLQKDMDVESTEKLLSSLKFVREQSHLINAEFSVVLQDLVKLEPTFTGMTDKISSIQGIWQMLLKDSQTLLSKLSDMSNTEYAVVFDMFATTLTITYETLQFSLGQYALAVAKPT